MNASRNETCALEAGKLEELQYTLSCNEQRRVCFTTLGVRAKRARETPENPLGMPPCQILRTVMSSQSMIGQIVPAVGAMPTLWALVG
ncbi:hypothetical protein CBS115989_9149 [Aspergillus niger]|nr:hypothetical protein CBS115989_9149 [Aspergillus niger]KAI2895195.1 hypothetical protein CBS13152_3902 [Aspergillus niger]KAI2903797.1 hypothetical protein CBS11852_1808 [Aspergillus niger]KAI2914689.1 hypothetical protein CBS147371_6163 [Aspergillus niger]KAI2936591.1 hypothetical protein CBS147321_8467 [Aspergillus niger]